MLSDDLAVSLVVLRAIRRFSQHELAEAAGITNSAVSDYERGKVDPQTQTLQRLLRALGLPLAALDQTQAFILTIRAQMETGQPLGDPGEGEADPAASQEREMRTAIAQLASEGARFAGRLTRMMLEILAARRA